MDDDRTPEPAPDPGKMLEDPESFREAHGRYGTYLKQGGLPFEPEELEDEATVEGETPAHGEGNSGDAPHDPQSDG